MPKLAHRVTMPRPNDPDIIRRFADATRKGHATATAAQLAGIGHATALQWLASGNADLDAHDAHVGTVLGSHAGFALEHKQALAELVDSKLDVIQDATAQPKGWLPAMTLIERRFPRDFGRNDRLEVETKSVSVHVTLDALPEGQREALIAALSRTPPQALLEAPSEHNDTA